MTLEKKVQIQQGIINDLVDENKELKEKLQRYSDTNIAEQLYLAEKARQEYIAVLAELKTIKEKYTQLVREVETDQKAKIKALKKLK